MEVNDVSLIPEWLTFFGDYLGFDYFCSMNLKFICLW